MDRLRALKIACQEIEREGARTIGHWPNFHSLHEAYGVCAEEMAEFFEELRKEKPDLAKLRIEAMHCAAMFARTMSELTPPSDDWGVESETGGGGLLP